ncbi:MAG: hypothetical protein PHO09_11955, partial [Sphaerochaeta sp.]|nr:hypothetical protein [Sphaerochaeta sp.]
AEYRLLGCGYRMLKTIGPTQCALTISIFSISSSAIGTVMKFDCFPCLSVIEKFIWCIKMNCFRLDSNER